MALIGIAEIDLNELAVRIIESIGHCNRPRGMTAEQVLAGTEADTRESALMAAHRCAEYLAEVVGQLKMPQ